MARKRIDWEEVSATVEELPELPPEDVHEIMAERGFTDRHVLLYRCEYVFNPLTDRKEKMAKVTCSACGETVYMEHVPADGGRRHGYATTVFFHYGLNLTVRHGDCTICHVCGKAVTAIHTNFVGGGGYEIEEHFMTSAHKVRGHLAVLRWRCSRMMMLDGTVRWRDYRGDGVLVVGGHAVAVRGYWKNFSTYSWGHPWEERKQFSELLGCIDKDHILPMEGIELGTEAENSGFSAYMAAGLDRYYPGAYLRTWTSHPNVENLARQGLRRYLNEVFSKASVYGYSYDGTDYSISITDEHINWRRVKPHEMLGIAKQDLWVAKSCSIDVVQHFRKLLQMEERGVRLTPEQLAAVEQIGVHRVVSAVEGTGYGFNPSEVKILNYMIKQQERLRGGVSNWGVTLLTDYWKSCAELNGGVVPESMRWPKDLKMAHDDVTARVRYKEDAELTEKFAERAEEMREYAYENEALGMCIRICRTQGEMIMEGKVLDHCVGRYTKDHANGKTTIFLVRRISEPDKPYYTLEWKDHRINQNHTSHNKRQTEEVLAFEREWLAHVAKIEAKMRKDKKNGIQEQSDAVAV